MNFRHALLGAIALACASCTVTTRVEKDATLAPEDAIFVIGSSPDHFRIWIGYAEFIEKDGATTVKQDMVGLPVLVANPEKGFLVGRVRGGATLQITGVRAVSENETFGPGFSACGGNRTMVFTAPPGKVVYIGHAQLTMQDKTRITARYSDDYEAARKYIDSNYRNLRGKVEKHGFRLVDTAPCPKGTYAITVPGR